MKAGRMARTLLAAVMVAAFLPSPVAQAARQGQTAFAWSDIDKDGKPEAYGVDWDDDGEIDEWWYDDDEDGVIDRVEVDNTHGDDSRSPWGRPGMRVRGTELAGGGETVAIDRNNDGFYDDVWWDYDSDGDVDDTDIYETESKLIDNTKATRFRGVFVGVNNPPLKHAEKDAGDMAEALAEHEASWDEADMTQLTGAAATPAAIKAAIDAAKADSKPGDEFVFYFSSHGGGWSSEDGEMDGGWVDGDGDEVANQVPESGFGRFRGSTLPTADPGFYRYRAYDMDGDGTNDTRVCKDASGTVSVRRLNPNPPPTWLVVGTDEDGDGDVDGDDGGVDMNADGDKDDMVGIDDSIMVGGGVEVSDDTVVQWLSGFPESVTIVVILDCCHSGSFTNDIQRITDKAGRPLRPGHAELIAAAAWDDFALERGIDNGVLTQALIDGLTALPPDAPGGHTTSAADLLGNEDDRTTTAELANWACPAVVTYMNADEDGDGIRNEDGLDCATSYEGTVSTAPVDDESNDSSTTPRVITRPPVDSDIDGDDDEDPDAQVTSFFDVYCDPEFGSRGTPRHLGWASGDDEFELTGMAPDIRVYAMAPLVPGTPSVPGPTLQFSIREVPAVYEPSAWNGVEEVDYASPVYDLSASIVTQTPALSEMTSESAPTLETVPLPNPLPAGLRVSIQAVEGVPVGACVPSVYDTATATWETVPDFVIDAEHNAVDFHPEHFSKYALLTPFAPPQPDEPPLPPRQLFAASVCSTVTIAWSNTTDPDWDRTRVLRSTTGYAADPLQAGQTVVHEGHEMSLSEQLAPGRYHYTAFSRDWGGNWSVPVTASASVPWPTGFTGLSSSQVLATYGATYTLAGKLVTSPTATGLPVVGRRVVLQQATSASGPWSNTSVTATTTATGSFSLAVKPYWKRYYRAAFVGDGDEYLASTSAARYALPRTWVGTPVAPATMYSTKTYVVAGFLKPRHAAGSYPVRIYRYRYYGGKWVAYGYQWAKAYDYSTYTKYLASVRLPYKGYWRLRAYAPADAWHAAAWSSGYDTVLVK